MNQRFHYSIHNYFLILSMILLLSACKQSKPAVPVENIVEPKLLPPTDTPVPPQSKLENPTPTPEIWQEKRVETAVFTSFSTHTDISTEIQKQMLYHLPIAGQMNVDWIISNYVDHDWNAYQALDYNDGQMTYDGHAGTDFLLSDLAKMEEGIAILAARAGIVVDLFDEATDTAEVGSESNYIIIEHSDGSTATYQHLRQGSARVTLGDLVLSKQPIGLVGLSGNSLNPHLHFELRSANGRLIDIFAEGLIAFNDAYPNKPYVFQAGITQLSDPIIHHDMFRYTPKSMTLLPTSATPVFWYKVVNVGPEDRLRTILVHPDGTQQELFTLQASQHQSVASWFIYADTLPPGWYSIWYFFNDDTARSESLSFQVVP